jgi:crossover junction endodeoxyribonuclease RuvC
MRILGIDPGLITTGYGIVQIGQGDAKVLEAGTIKPSPTDPFELRITKVYEHISAILRAHQPDSVVLEKLYSHHKHPTTACILGHVRGVICLAVCESKTPLVEHSVKRIRQALLGNGNATKPQVQEFVKRMLNIPKTSMPLDTSDALALALGHAHMLRFQLVTS